MPPEFKPPVGYGALLPGTDGHAAVNRICHAMVAAMPEGTTLGDLYSALLGMYCALAQQMGLDVRQAMKGVALDYAANPNHTPLVILVDGKVN